MTGRIWFDFHDVKSFCENVFQNDDDFMYLYINIYIKHILNLSPLWLHGVFSVES